MPPRLAALCQHLILEKYGNTATHVFTVLARHGRLAVPQLQYHTGFPIRHLKPIVHLLLQHGLLLWHQIDDGELVYYQVDWHAAYTLVRQGKIMQMVEDRHGKAASDLLEKVLAQGKVEVGDLEDQQTFYMASPRDSGIGMMDDQSTEDGTANDCKITGDEHTTTAVSFHHILRVLLEEGFLSKVTSHDRVPVAELEEEIRTQVILADPRAFKDGKTTGPKTAVTFINAANALKRKWRDEAEYSAQRDLASHGTIKRGNDPRHGSNKRRKVGSSPSDGFHDLQVQEEEGDVDVEMSAPECSVQKLPNDLWLRVNYNKCMIALRSERLKDMAEHYFGQQSAAVYGALLQVAEGKSHHARSQLRVKSDFSFDDDGEAMDNAEITILDAEIADLVDKELDLLASIKLPANPSTDGTAKSNKRKRTVPDGDEDIADLGIKQEAESDEEDEDPLVNGVEPAESRQKRLNHLGMHLDLLGESSKTFLRRNTNKRTSTVSFAVLSNMLAAAEVDQMIVARSGPIGLRVCRILREKGKLQDTQIAGFCLKRLKDLRAILTNLQSLGFIDVQEMPKDNYRQPSRTIYLWSFNESEVRGNLLQDTYHGMSRSMERLDMERERAKDIIEKAESVNWDIKRLNKPERDLLAQWHATEQILTVALERLDDVAMVLRDFDEADTSLRT